MDNPTTYIVLIYGGLLTIIWFAFKVARRHQNPFKNLWFWATFILAAIGLTIYFIYLFFRAFGGPPAEEGWNRKYFDNGKLQSEFFVKDGKTEGYSKYWFQNGQLEFLTKYKNGVEDDTSFVYFENGKIHWIDVYKEGKQISSVVFYPTGLKESEYYNPIDTGENNFRIDYYSTGKKKFETRISNSTFEGLGVYYFANGDTSFKGNYKQGQKDGVWFKYDSITGKIFDRDTFNYKIVRQFKKSW